MHCLCVNITEGVQKLAISFFMISRTHTMKMTEVPRQTMKIFENVRPVKYIVQGTYFHT